MKSGNVELVLGHSFRLGFLLDYSFKFKSKYFRSGFHVTTVERIVLSLKVNGKFPRGNTLKALTYCILLGLSIVKGQWTTNAFN